MPAHCAAYGCKQRRTAESKKEGITFHRFPGDDEMRRMWEKALRRKDFTANKETVLCSDHFECDDIDRTGQICRIRPGVIPSIFNFPDRPRKVRRKEKNARTTKTSMKAKESMPQPLITPPKVTKKKPSFKIELDHNYSLPSCPDALKAKFKEFASRLWALEKEKRNAQVRERRARNTLMAVLHKPLCNAFI
nr:THAP domain-containing protein 2-like [Nerophis lumbriciformis]